MTQHAVNVRDDHAADVAILAYCRAGFELECATELNAAGAALNIPGQAQHHANSGYVLWQAATADGAPTLFGQIEFSSLIFARAWFLVRARCRDLPQHNRVGPIVDAARKLEVATADVIVETPDSEATKPLAPLCRGIEAPLRKALTSANLLNKEAGQTRHLHVCFISTNDALIGWSDTHNASPWPMGIPRLKSSRDAPSRSALKLEEALLQFDAMGHLKPGMVAVDLGAAPGGWTWILTQHHVRVVAVDNGALQRSLLDSGLVEHRREDGFRFQPKRRVDWLVCDMVEKPRRIATLVAQWLAQGWCSRVVANLKLPMKKRYEEVALCLELIEQQAADAGVHVELRARQLYHDREEITLYATARRRRST